MNFCFVCEWLKSSAFQEKLFLLDHLKLLYFCIILSKAKRLTKYFNGFLRLMTDEFIYKFSIKNINMCKKM